MIRFQLLLQQRDPKCQIVSEFSILARMITLQNLSIFPSLKPAAELFFAEKAVRLATLFVLATSSLIRFPER